MHRRTALYTRILLLTLGTAAQAASVPPLVTHQGRLLDASDNPVTGTRSLTFSVYETPSGGAPLWLEVHPSVQVTEGLYTVLLGSVTPLSSDLFSPPASGGSVERYLEMSVDGVALTPRLRISSTPYSVSSSRVDGDVVTAPGELSVSGLGGSTTATIRSSSNPGAQGSSLEMMDGSGSTTGTIRASAASGGEVELLDGSGSTTGTIRASTATGGSLTLGHMSGSTTATIRAASTGGEMELVDGSGSTTGTIRASTATGGSLTLGHMSGSTTATIRHQASPDSAFSVLDLDADNDGLADVEEVTRITPTSASLAIQTKGTGAKRVGLVANTDTAAVLVSFDSVSIPVECARTGGKVTGSVKLTNGSALKVGLDSDGNVYIDSSLGIGVTASHPIDVAGGAYCDGTTWSNASDVNAKENFQSVDGAELLNRLADLKITRWSYKSLPGVDHIGPTAQDFLAAFGVGASDKSISTVDPSGIALAAIQELQKQNQNLARQNAELREQLERLTRKVNVLTAAR